MFIMVFRPGHWPQLFSVRGNVWCVFQNTAFVLLRQVKEVHDKSVTILREMLLHEFFGHVQNWRTVQK